MSALHPFINKSKRSSFAILPASENETAPAPPTQEITTQTHRKSALASPTFSLSRAFLDLTLTHAHFSALEPSWNSAFHGHFSPLPAARNRQSSLHACSAARHEHGGTGLDRRGTTFYTILAAKSRTFDSSDWHRRRNITLLALTRSVRMRERKKTRWLFS